MYILLQMRRMPTSAYVISSTTQYEKEQVVNLFHRKAKFTNTVIKDTVGMEDPWRYRNKSQIPVGLSKDQQPIMDFTDNEVMTSLIWKVV